MAAKASVEVATLKVVKAFDKKYEKSLLPVMKTAAERAIKGSSTMQLGANARFSIDISVTSLACTKDEKSATLEAKVSMSVADKASMFGFPSGGGKVPNANLKKLDDDVEALVESIITDLVADKVSKAVADRVKNFP
jgi:hypothetical protein